MSQGRSQVYEVEGAGSFDAPRTALGWGAVSEVASALERLAADSVLLVADRRAFAASGAEAALAEALSGRRVQRIDVDGPNPDAAAIEVAVARCRAMEPDVVLAVGGGSAIDLAKAVAGCCGTDAEVVDVLRGRAAIGSEVPPLIAVPTTAGTGSEATHFAALYVEGRKVSLAHQKLRPAYAIVDPSLSRSAPRELRAVAGLDAFAQALESAWAVDATERSLADSCRALELAGPQLDDVVHAPSAAAFDAMARAAFHAGRAIDVAKTTAAHALSYWLTAKHGVAHGHAVALFLGPILSFNAQVSAQDCVDPRGAEAVKARLAAACKAMKISGPAALRVRWDAFLQSLSIPTRLSEVGVKTEDDRQALVDAVNPERLSNNPRRLDRAALERIVAEADGR